MCARQDRWTPQDCLTRQCSKPDVPKARLPHKAECSNASCVKSHKTECSKARCAKSLKTELSETRCAKKNQDRMFKS